MNYNDDVLTPKTQTNLTNAKTYFEEHLAVGDYYTEGETVAGEWIGKGASMLGLDGIVNEQAFLRLCDNLHPETGALLTQRRKTVRRNEDRKEVPNRRVFYDFTFSPPKSVSIVALIGKDRRITDAHRRAVKSAMIELERFAETRVRMGKECSDRSTENLVTALFQHDTSRALDPHLHTHCIVFNATFDPVEQRWKALQNYEMLLARKYVENVYYHELARSLTESGYEIENRQRGDFEIKGVTKALCETFSKRHAEIDEKTRALIASQPDKAHGNIAELRGSIARVERSRKIKDITASQLQALWKPQMSETEGTQLAALIAHATAHPLDLPTADVRSAIAWAEEHLFDRKSVVHEHEIWQHALEHGRGHALSLTAIHEATKDADFIRDSKKPKRLTTHSVLLREYEIVEMAKEGAFRFDSLNSEHRWHNSQLDEDQRRAVMHILKSRDFVTLFRGGAGTGKSYALREVQLGLDQVRKASIVIAPQRQQVMDLKRDGFVNVQTVSEFLTRKKMPRNAVVIVDEAGQLGAKQMHELLTYVNANEGRIIFSGDTRQHGAVEASDALRAIEKYSGLTAAELNVIRRQDPERAKSALEKAFIAQYRKAVEEAADRNMAKSFDCLEKAGAIVECTLADQQDKLAAHYLDLARSEQSAVIVSQTWSEIHKVNETIREVLQSQGLIGKSERLVETLERIDLTDAQKRDTRFYDAESVIVLNRDVCGLRKNHRAIFRGITDRSVILETAERVREIPFRLLDRLTVCRKREVVLATGDRLQLKANAMTNEGRRLANGELVTVAKVYANGNILLRDGRRLGKDYRQFVRGYAVTSYASQGKTVDYVLFSDSTVKAATSAQQWYVTISRGRKGVKVFTSDKTQLRENIIRSGDRDLALDLTLDATKTRQPKRQRKVNPLTRFPHLAVVLRTRLAAFLASRKQKTVRAKINHP